MKVFRFMSNKEFYKLINGELLENKTEHKARTNSIGFCFLRCDDFKPKDAIHFLSGICDIEKCVVFEVDESYLKETYGIYADHTHTQPTGDILQDLYNLYEHFQDTFRTREYCTTNYSIKNFNIISYATPEYFKEEWEWIEYDR